MAADATLSATVRDEFGKGASRRTRRAHLVPAVLYGHGMDPIHLALPGHATMLALRLDNALLEINVEGESKARLALAKQIQRDPIRGDLIHVDLQAVNADEKVVVEIALQIIGDSAPDTTVAVDQNSISIEAPVSDIPEEIQIDVEGLEAGAQIQAKDLKLASGVTYVGDPEDVLVSVNHANANEVPESGAAAVEATEPAAE
ncbi:large subunit ribosomal protein L25 [Raineyella antarctica]|uniref:Large ribosomal subunit protein bL25 n=1 Tax=Raineyella antarctica TaxID=1577474 RepID=A0A1G6GD67_9ACTN|nr:50S ribosomal protein L25/general stress protein Ctc [Raineyella antarctica]SDB79910.1 large subunit ribosomal protein L25 [Raineyella antarctica]